MTDGCSVVVSQAIDESIAENRIVWIDDPDGVQHADLFEACDDYSEDTDRGVREYWGEIEDADGNMHEWRVRARYEASS